MQVNEKPNGIRFLNSLFSLPPLQTIFFHDLWGKNQNQKTYFHKTWDPDAISWLPTQDLMETPWIFGCQAEWLLFTVKQWEIQI